MIHSLELRISKSRDDGDPVLLPPTIWRSDAMPSRMLFFACVEERYEEIELPWFPHAAEVYVELSDRMAIVDAGEAVAPAHEVAQDLWVKVATLSSGV